MAKLSSSDRNKLPKGKFAEPDTACLSRRGLIACAQREGTSEPGGQGRSHVDERGGEDRHEGGCDA